MNRIIKFRGKRVDNGEWVVGDLLTERNKVSKDMAIVFYDGYMIPKSVAVIPGTVGQYTGMKDEDDNEIYEGDIIEFSVFDHNGADTQYKGFVKWANAMFEIWHDAESEYYGSDGGFVLAWVHYQDDCIKKIGTIHDNPELLKEATNG